MANIFAICCLNNVKKLIQRIYETKKKNFFFIFLNFYIIFPIINDIDANLRPVFIIFLEDFFVSFKKAISFFLKIVRNRKKETFFCFCLVSLILFLNSSS